MGKTARNLTHETLLAVLCLGTLAVGTPATAAVSVLGEGSCVVEVSPGGQNAAWTSSSTSGRWLSGFDSSGSPIDDNIIVWHDGEIDVLDVPLEPRFSSGINRRGVVVGSGNGMFEPTVAFAHDGSTYTPLGAPAGVRSVFATGISNSGLISGTGETATGFSVPIVWSLDQPDRPRVLGTPGDQPARTIDMSGNGLIGLVVGRGAHTRSFLVSPSGRRTEFPTTEPGAHVSVSAVGNNWAVGLERDPDGGTFVVRYSLKTDILERIDVPNAADINADGWVVGTDADAGFLYTDHFIPLPPASGSNGTSAYTVDDRGHPAGQASVNDFQDLPARWTC